VSEAAAQELGLGSRRLVARNTLIMMTAQALGVPLAIIVNAVMARTLGPEEY
jgi:O-antigen/teichoic acid export membrane protein